MVNRIIAACLLFFVAIISALFFGVAAAIWLCTVLFDRRLVILHKFTSFWACTYLWISPPWVVSMEGRSNIRKDATYVIVSNHQSLLDILVVFRLFFHFKWVAKEEAFKIPFIGWNMALNRYIRLKRGDRDSIKKMYRECKKTIADGSSIYIFPEGTRSKSGVMKAFKPGAFNLAREMKAPILPVVINGTKNALPKRSLNFHGRSHIRIKVLDEIPYERFADFSTDELAEMVRDLIARHVDEHRQPPGKESDLK